MSSGVKAPPARPPWPETPCTLCQDALRHAKKTTISFPLHKLLAGLNGYGREGNERNCASCRIILEIAQRFNPEEITDQTKECLKGFQANLCPQDDALFRLDIEVAQLAPRKPLRSYFQRSINLNEEAKYLPSIEVFQNLTPVVSTTDSDFSLAQSIDSTCDFIRDRLNDCERHHGEPCRASYRDSQRLPTRLIDVDSIHPDVRVCKSTPSMSERYIILSYCWGKGENFRLLQGKLKQMMQRIAISELPPLLQDSITVARRLGATHIWIDALCILQDNEWDDPKPDPETLLNAQKDQAKELPRMGEYYHNANLTIAASSASGVEEPFLELRDQTWEAQEFSMVKSDRGFGNKKIFPCKTFTAHHRRIQPDYKYLVLDAPLSKRAWTYQENIMSRRIVHFDKSGVIWECGEKVVAEPRKTKNTYVRSQGTLIETKALCRLIKGGQWNEIVETYTKRSLTYAIDKLPAISAVAELKAVDLGSKYLAGMMGIELQNSLFWLRSIDVSAAEIGNSIGLMLPTTKSNQDTGLVHQYTAPSWSWASIVGPVRCTVVPAKMIRILSAECEVIDENLYGKVTSGHIRLEAPIFKADLHFTPNKSFHSAYSLLRNKIMSSFFPDSHIQTRSIRGPKGGDQQETAERCLEPPEASFRVPVYCVAGSLTKGHDDVDGAVLWLLVLGVAQTDTRDTFVRLGVGQVIRNFPRSSFGSLNSFGLISDTIVPEPANSASATPIVVSSSFATSSYSSILSMSLSKRKRTRESTVPTENEGPSNSSNHGSASSESESIQLNPQHQDKHSSIGDSPNTFQALGILQSLCDACESLGYTKPTPIQAQSIPIALQGRDLIGLAETGSGKTAAFALPILQALINQPQPLHSLILAPTRELAQQTSKVIEALGSLVSVRCALLIGGLDMVSQSIALGKKPHVVVATPGRLLDHLENTKGFSLRQLKYLVLDEADRLLDLDFGPILDKVLKILPKRTTYLFSATMSSKVESLQRASLSNPVRVSATTEHQTVSTLLQSYIFIPFKHKDVYLIHTLDERAGQMAIIFTRTVNESHRISIMLRHLGFSAIPLHGQLSQSARLAALNKFRLGSRSLLIATDVAARGLDIPSVDLIINYDLPQDSKTYIHRVGRTARAGKSGSAVSFVTQYDVELWLRIETAIGQKLEEQKLIKDEVMIFAARVGDAQRMAMREMKDLQDKKGNSGTTLKHKRNGKRSRGDMDQDEG
ncbi:uncharacterized protein BP5553_09377 [Venustampulla echinocandica]|uniref:ATP-dependent rRNA helicase RRP3 n=1 Tax=Venustampulla echinocandica TaxID=2656787 RepID=A0A370TCL9_9HELO|nr:uncharacterized protein BP5553_09377 [Venustampulla echinocandica]RDL31975.1 hypothetical protein BP5553_09377 [Venustampulla echinocandica]